VPTEIEAHFLRTGPVTVEKFDHEACGVNSCSEVHRTFWGRTQLSKSIRFHRQSKNDACLKTGCLHYQSKAAISYDRSGVRCASAVKEAIVLCWLKSRLTRVKLISSSAYIQVICPRVWFGCIIPVMRHGTDGRR